MLLARDIATHGVSPWYGVVHGAQALALRAALQPASAKSVVMVCHTDREAETLRGQLQFIIPTIETITFPAWDCLPYDRSSPNASITAARLHALTQLLLRREEKNPAPLVVITTLNALMQRTLPTDILRASILRLQKGSTIDRATLQETLLQLGYSRVAKVMEAGEYAFRGDILDVFVPGMERGCRIDLFGDEIESLRYFDPMSQRSEGNIDGFVLKPAGELLLNQAAINQFRLRYREAFGVPHKDDALYETITAGHHPIGAEHWLPLFYPRMHTLLDYTGPSVVILDHQTEATRKERLETIADYYAARHSMDGQKHKNRAEAPAPYNPLPPHALYLDDTAWQQLLEQHACLQLSPFVPEDVSTTALQFGTRATRNFAAERREGAKIFDAIAEYNQTAARKHQHVLIACHSLGTLERLKELLSNHGMVCERVENWSDATQCAEGIIALGVFPLERGFEAAGMCVLAEQDIMGERISRTSKRKKTSDYFFAEAAALSEGDLVVHREHGIGRFIGLVTMEVANLKRDCLKIIYDGDDKLFIPVENIEIISRYGQSDDEHAVLDKLGSTSWQSRKARMKERIRLAAEELLKTAADRAIQRAPAFHPQAELYSEFCRRFAFAETEDQEKAIDEVLEDLASGQPMDRLICGDVGFGKTEVALRAAAAVAFAETPAQVAIITPTTLLARQHYANFSKRFADMPVTIRQLSRMVSAKDAKETQEMLQQGKVDIVIGTHALLGKSIEFANLGLLVVDEEQHFGVAQKERIKALRSSVHVLTLSATPIPRTLQLALSGVRELSLITTPPVDRLAVRTFVMPFDPLVLREAILRERHRGGQVFYVTPRIADLAELQVRIREMVPEARIAVAHGQMPTSDLDTIMTDFYDGKYDVLLSTTIVESGLDVPSANTLIINRADRFGLGQLYQLRGRVGRGKTRAYAYLTLQHQRSLTPTAMRRLEVMQSLDTLGAGFSVASHDMDIRGFGNLLGEEQSGHVKEVGVELYQHMLEEAVASARKRAKAMGMTDASSLVDAPSDDDDWTPTINLGISVLIPEAYVADLELRMGLYRRASALASAEEIDEFAVELVDRFGSYPTEVEHLLMVLKTKLLCKQAGIEKLDAGPKGITLTFRPAQALKPEAVLGFVARSAGKAKLRPDNKLVVLEEWRTENARLQGVQHTVQSLAALAA